MHVRLPSTDILPVHKPSMGRSQQFRWCPQTALQPLSRTTLVVVLGGDSGGGALQESPDSSERVHMSHMCCSDDYAGPVCVHYTNHWLGPELQDLCMSHTRLVTITVTVTAVCRATGASHVVLLPDGLAQLDAICPTARSSGQAGLTDSARRATGCSARSRSEWKAGCRLGTTSAAQLPLSGKRHWQRPFAAVTLAGQKAVTEGMVKKCGQ